MTRYTAPSLLMHGSALPIGDGTTHDRSYEVKQGSPQSVYSGKANCVQTVGRCRTPHAVNVAQPLVNGLCKVCLACQE